MHKLCELGIPVERNQGKGYRFTRPVEMLDKTLIWQQLSPETQALIPHFEIADSVQSTNCSMEHLIDEGKESGTLLLAEHQTAGRARFGRRWHSPYAANIYLSLYWHFRKDTSELSGLSQLIALSVLNALQAHHVSNLTLKWPNDIYHNDKKLASVLIEMNGESHSSTDCIIGVGVNVSMPDTEQAIDQPWTDIHAITQQFPARNLITASIINTIYTDLIEFNLHGFKSFINRWADNDGLANKNITAHNTHQTIEGVAKGLGSMGELLIETSEGLASLLNGSVKLREESE